MARSVQVQTRRTWVGKQAHSQCALVVLIRFIVGEDILLGWESGLRLVLVVHSIDLRQQPVLWLVDNLEARSRRGRAIRLLLKAIASRRSGSSSR